MMRNLLLIAMAVCLAGCGGGGEESLEAFGGRWHKAINSGDAGLLYGMLDTGSRRGLEEDLRELRGLEGAAQRAVLDQLGGVRVKSFLEVSPERYFGLLWHRATDGLRPTMKVFSEDERRPYMVLTIGGERRERVELVREGGQWRWRLPDQGSFRRGRGREGGGVSEGGAGARP